MAGQAVDAERVLDANEYWAMPTGEWLTDLLPLVRTFLQKHQNTASSSVYQQTTRSTTTAHTNSSTGTSRDLESHTTSRSARSSGTSQNGSQQQANDVTRDLGCDRRLRFTPSVQAVVESNFDQGCFNTGRVQNRVVL
jgi:hypothetical protein